jgi:hypothetical protein
MLEVDSQVQELLLRSHKLLREVLLKPLLRLPRLLLVVEPLLHLEVVVVLK